MSDAPFAVQNAKHAVVEIGGGRGFIVSGGESRYIVTAAHCLPSDRLPTPHLANSTSELTFPKIIGRIGAKRKTIWAELCVFALADDLAVFATPDGLDLYDQCTRYEKFTQRAMMVGEPPVSAEPWKNPPGSAAWVFSLNGQWQRCTVVNNGRFLNVRPARLIKSGMSGSPIINDKGAGIGVVSTSGGDHSINPSLLDCLPTWLLRKLDVDQTSGPTSDSLVTDHLAAP
jgi:hypothetical protein